jgi:hypothetical protein
LIAAAYDLAREGHTPSTNPSVSGETDNSSYRRLHDDVTGGDYQQDIGDHFNRALAYKNALISSKYTSASDLHEAKQVVMDLAKAVAWTDGQSSGHQPNLYVHSVRYPDRLSPLQRDQAYKWLQDHHLEAQEYIERHPIPAEKATKKSIISRIGDKVKGKSHQS